MIKILNTFLGKMFQPFKDWNVSWLPLIILNNFKDFEIPDEDFTFFYFSLTIWIFIFGDLINLFNILLTLTILYYKNKYNLELKFNNYPLIVRIIKFYEKISYLTIALEVFWILIFTLFILAFTTYMIFKIAKIF
jgi:hypothetical protein